MSTPILTWLHISDVHFGHGDAAYRKNQQFILTDLIDDIKKQINDVDIPTPEILLMTGDVAFSGKSDEYTQAKKWFCKLSDATNIDKTAMFFVPGNHDVVRCSPEKNQDAFYRVRYLREEGDLDRVLSDTGGKSVLMSRLEEFQKFAADFGPPGLHNDVAWSHIFATAAGVNVKIVGLNSAILCNDERDDGKLQLGLAQLELCRRSPESNLPEIIIALTHHPLDWLRDGRSMSLPLLNRMAQLHLAGHVHIPNTESILSGSGGELVHVIAGAAHDETVKTDRMHSYNISHLSRRDGQFFLRVWPRAWSRVGYRVHVGSVPDGAKYATHPVAVAWNPMPDPKSKPAEPPSEHPPARVVDVPEDHASRLELFPGSGLYSSLDLRRKQFVRLRVDTTPGFVEREHVSPTGVKHTEPVETKNQILIVRDPIRPIEIQIGLTRAMRPGGDPGSVPLVDGLTLESLRVMYPLIIADPSFRWLRMVFAELASRPEVLKYIYDADVDPEIRRIVVRNPSAEDSLKAKDCPFCNGDFLKRREIDMKSGARAINNDYPYGPYFHFIVMPNAPVHSWEKVTTKHLEDMNFLVQELLQGYLKSVGRAATGVRIGLNSTIRHVVLGKSTRTSAGASVPHVHKQVWGMTPVSVSASDYLEKICKEASARGVDYLDSYMDVLRQCDCVIWEDGAAVLYVPLGQMSAHELPIMLKRPNSGSFSDLSQDEIKSLSRAEFYVTRLYQKMEINSFNELMFVKPFAKVKEDDKFRLLCTFITREIDLAVSELNSAYVVDKKPEDTIALAKKHFPDVMKES